MSKTCLPPLIATLLTLSLACGGADTAPPASGDEVTIAMPDGSLVTGRVAQPAPETLVPAVSQPVSQEVAPVPQEMEYVEVTVPAGTTLFLEMDSALASNVSRVEDSVRARIERAVFVGGVAAIPDGSVVHGTVTTADPSGKVKGRAKLAFRFEQLDIDHDRYALRSELVRFEAKGNRTRDAKKVGLGAGAGALIGGLLGGAKGAGAGAAIGGGAGTAMVLTTAGEEVELRPGTAVEVDLAEDVVVVVPQA
jgi:hypothetical protein